MGSEHYCNTTAISQTPSLVLPHRTSPISCIDLQQSISGYLYKEKQPSISWCTLLLHYTSSAPYMANSQNVNAPEEARCYIKMHGF